MSMSRAQMGLLYRLIQAERRYWLNGCGDPSTRYIPLKSEYERKTARSLVDFGLASFDDASKVLPDIALDAGAPHNL
ncbi:MAG: hypothetical protein VBE63_08310 [Lamprobacter sp.]|uniref:hypothetical protein n=1 Tax=Lamprobacter sp. TaxID=3100796 RepID=UPI002B25772A|nr:hypothetical protein [Lamprobacter sp.]MEA3639932.1 hypothetical protein [Lamprobacter sp.]